MTAVIQITDGTTTVDLMALSPNHYVPKNRIAFTDNVEDSVTEVLGVYQVSSAAGISAALTTVRSVEKLLEDAEEFQKRGSGKRVYLTFNPTGSGTNYRSEILRGKLDWDDEALVWKLNAGYIVDVNIMFARRAYWEENTETELTTATTGDTVLNHTDGSHVNYFDVDDALVTGVTRGKCRLTLKNNSAGAIGKIFIGTNRHKGSAMPTHQLEGESATGMTSHAAVGTSSNDAYGDMTSASSSTVEAARWTLSAADLAKFIGNHYRAIMRGAGNNGIYAQLKVCYVSTTVELSSTTEVLLNTDTLHDLGSIQVPPYTRGVQTLTAVDVVLFCRKSGGFTVTCDFIQLFGVDNWMVLSYISGSAGLIQNATLTVDSITHGGWQYVVDASGNYSGHYNAVGESLEVEPGEDHRFYILAMLTDGTAPIDQSITCRLWCRAARLTI